MRNELLVEMVARWKTVSDLAAKLLPGREKSVYGLAGGIGPLFMGGLYSSIPRPVLLVVENAEEASRWLEDMEAYLPAGSFAYFPPREFLPYGIRAQSPEISAHRLSAFKVMRNSSQKILAITTIESLTQGLVPPEVWEGAALSLKCGQEYDLKSLVSCLVAAGYRRQDVVDAPGTMAVRGGIIDVYPLAEENPLRLEFFDCLLDSVRFFDPVTQRSLGKKSEVDIPPAEELILSSQTLEHGLSALKEEMEKTVRRFVENGKADVGRRLRERVEGDLERAELGLGGLTAWQAYFYPQRVSFLEYFNQVPLVVWVEPERLGEKWKALNQERHTIFAQFMEDGMALSGQYGIYMTYEELQRLAAMAPQLNLSLLPCPRAGVQGLEVTSRPFTTFKGRITQMAAEVKGWRQQRNRVVLFVSSVEKGKNLQQALWGEGIEAPLMEKMPESLLPGQVVIVPGGPRRGGELKGLKLDIVSDEEVFGPRDRIKPRKRFKDGVRVGALTELKVSDFVVHSLHGIGRYLGIEQITVSGVSRDYMKIQYGGADQLYVPTDQVEMVQKYIGAEARHPRLNRLGGSEWARIKGRAKEAVQEMARELLELYAARQALPGYAFSPDSVWQREFEAAFPYHETPDQLRAVEEVKRDMESPRPMDRLLCGDVGYGKTEVAMRAAFKAVTDGKQVAVLVPTTVLAQQHLNTFSQRFAPYPVKIATLSRFDSPQEQARAIAGLKSGAVDLVIGTHRLLSRDVSFHSLGLLVIDEEQRFGVSHKERLKRLRQNIDVLTLTATPIPRTLHMSMVGARDLSVIETPPEDRFPVQTYVVEHSWELVRDALSRELARGGQVYYVYNRVEDISALAFRIKEIIPKARVAVAHGQMSEGQLEQVMIDFVNHAYDVLVCTTIVENGLDIPNVNTLIVHGSDSMGLAQLYQLRGRVGRTNRLAYAYLTFQRNKVLSQVAEKRLAAIREFTELGSGLRVALRDLEIRGAGNILGAEQHGHLVAVGFDLYCRLLQDAVENLKGVAPKQEQAVPAVELGVDAFINNEYMPHQGLKMEIYQRVMTAANPEGIDDLEAELADRFGDPPQEMRNLLSLARIRLLSQETLISNVRQEGEEIILTFGGDHGLAGETLMELAAAFPQRIFFSASGGLAMRFRTRGLGQRRLLHTLERVLGELRRLKNDKRADIMTGDIM